MAWIESHQTLRDHPKLMRLARLLDVPRTSAAGLLHFLWWWALDHAEDGDLTDFDPLDLALAAGWEGDPDTFVKALEDCGPGDRAGFVAHVNGRRVLHDWHDYAGKLVDRRVKDRERKRQQREKSDTRPPDVPRTSGGSPGVQYRTQPNPTLEEPSPPAPAKPPRGRSRPRSDDHSELFAALVEACGYTLPIPGVEGGKIGKCAKQLREIGATPDDVHRRAKAYRQRWPDIDLTPTGLVANWAQVTARRNGTGPARVAADACQKCGQSLQQHDSQLCAILAKAS